jgi:hypothetical protein
MKKINIETNQALALLIEDYFFREDVGSKTGLENAIDLAAAILDQFNVEKKSPKNAHTLHTPFLGKKKP